MFSFCGGFYKTREGVARKLIYVRQQAQEEDVLLVQGIGIGLGLKLSFVAKSQRFGERPVEKHIGEYFGTHVGTLRIFGFHLEASPPANQLTALLNIAHLLRINSREEEAVEADIVLCLCLISGRRFVQASEILRRAS
jgi:hypothetical protein